MSEHRQPAGWQAIASVSIVLILACALFVVIYATMIVPKLMTIPSRDLSLLVRMIMRPIFAIAVLIFLAGGTAAGLARPRERAIILSLTAGAGLVLVFGEVITIFVVIFSPDVY